MGDIFLVNLRPMQIFFNEQFITKGKERERDGERFKRQIFPVVDDKHHTKGLTTGNSEDFLCLVLCKINSIDTALHLWNDTSLVTAVI